MIDRYCLSPIKKLWEDEYRFNRMLDIEIKVCEILSKKGVIPEKDYLNIKNKALVDVKDIQNKELDCRHETVAFIQSVSEKIGESSKYFHFGLTSSDVLDTALSLVMRDSLKVISCDTKELKKEVLKKARKYKKIVVIGRTHGMHAEPTTLGLKFLGWVYQLERDVQRLEASLEVISYGKISGSVGTYAQVNPFVEKYVCKQLGLKPAKISTQILQRDRHAQYLFSLSMLGNTLEKIATEIRHLHRTEISEVFEPFGENQKGSSSMPHKRNPILCERICGLARVLRGNTLVGMENIPLWHERDMSHSSAERIVLADSSCLVHFLLNDMLFIIRNIDISKENIIKNLELSKGKIYSQSLMLKLVSKGMDKKEAYDLIQKTSFEDSDFIEKVENMEIIKKYLTKNDLDELFNYDYYTRYVDEIFKRFEKKQ